MVKNKKIIALILGMMMTLSLMPQTVLGSEFDGVPEYTNAYEGYFNGWSRWDAAKTDGNLTFSCVTNEISHSGNNSIVLRHVDNSQKMKNICLAQSGMSLEAGNYTISFWATGTRSDIDMQGVTLADPWRKYSMRGRQAVETDGIWSRYEIEVTMFGSETALTFVADGDTVGWYIDDISLVKDGTEVNRVKNGGFEDNGIPTYTTDYEDYLAGWAQWYVADKDEKQYFSCVTNETAHDGSNSVVIRHTDSSKKFKAVSVVQENMNLTGTYTLSFWAKGARTDIDMQCVTLNGEEWVKYSMLGRQAAETDGAWSKYVFDVTVPNGKTNNTIAFCVDGDTDGWYIDDISLVKKGTTENVINNGSFEAKESGGDTPEVPEAPDAPVYTKDHEDYFYGWSRWDAAKTDGDMTFSCVTDEIAYDGNNSIVLRHVDNSQKMKNICLAQSEMSLDAGAYTISFWAAGTRTDIDMQGVTLADPWRRYSMMGRKAVETDGMWSKYEIDVTVQGDESALTFTVDGDTTGWYIDDISLVKKGTQNNLIKNGSFEEKEVVGDTPEVPEVPENPTYTTAYDDFFYGWSDWSAVERDGELVFLCVTDEASHSGNNSFVLRHIDNSKPSNICLAQNVPSLEPGKYTISFWSSGVKNNGLQAVTLADPWMRYALEQFTVTETDGAWSKYELTVTATGGETAITFPTDGQTEGWYIDDISLVKEGTTENLITNGGFEEINPDSPVGDVVREVVLKKNGQRTDKLSGQGDYSITLVVNNHAVSNKLNVEQFVAIYDEEGVLYDKVRSTAASIQKDTAVGAFTKIETSFNLPEGKYTVEYFVLDGRNTRNIVGSPNPHRIFAQND